MPEMVIELKTKSDIVAARQAGREMASELGFGSADQTRLATAISELVRNVIQYAGEGVCLIAGECKEHETRIQVVVEDAGPGIPDVEGAMAHELSDSESLGAGLPRTKRLVQEFDIESQPGHTRVSIAITRTRL